METLLEYKAGKMLLEGLQVRADTRKGVFRLAKDETGLLHVQWLDRVSGAVEDDTIVLPDEAVFEKVQQSNGRVYILKFKCDDRKMFYWLQEPDAAGDARLCTEVNAQINQPLEDSPVELTEERETMNIADAGKATPSTVGGRIENARNPPVQLAELQQILANLGQSLAGAGASTTFEDPGPTLAEVLKPEHVLPLLENNKQWEERLAQYLPEGKWTLESIGELMQSPQFRQQLDMFTHALRTGQLDLQQFGIDPSQCDFTVASFLEAIENQVAAKKVENLGSEDANADDMDE